MGKVNITVVTQDKEAITTVESILSRQSPRRSHSVCTTVGELRTRLSKPGANGDIGVAMVDIDPDPDATLVDVSRLTAAHPRTRFMVLSTDASEQLILDAMQAGARHFLRKRSIAAELDSVLERLLSHDSHVSGRLADVISVFSCSGGCGATTIAVNLANELRLMADEPVLLIDLDCHYGSVASHLGMTGDYGIAHILSRGNSIDSHLIGTGAVRFMHGLDVLLSPAAAAADGPLPMQWDSLSKAVEACREVYRYVVIDAPRVPEQAAADLAASSHAAVVVFQLTIRDIAFAKGMVSFLREHGVGAVVPLANRVSWRGPLLTLREGERALGMKPVRSIRNDWRSAVKSASQGRPLAEVARRSRLRRDVCKLAQRIHT
jgi:pilus assembly protein CpaE